MLVSIAAQTQNWQSIVRQQVKLMGLWQDGGSGAGVDAIHEIDPGVTVVTLPGSGCLATVGELNAVADFVANAGAVNTMPASFMFPFLQQIRQEKQHRSSAVCSDACRTSALPDHSLPGRGGRRRRA